MTTQNVVRKFGRGVCITEEEQADILRYARMGYTKASVAELVGVSRDTIRNYWPAGLPYKDYRKTHA